MTLYQQILHNRREQRRYERRLQAAQAAAIARAYAMQVQLQQSVVRMQQADDGDGDPFRCTTLN